MLPCFPLLQHLLVIVLPPLLSIQKTCLSFEKATLCNRENRILYVLQYSPSLDQVCCLFRNTLNLARGTVAQSKLVRISHGPANNRRPLIFCPTSSNTATDTPDSIRQCTGLSASKKRSFTYLRATEISMADFESRKPRQNICKTGRISIPSTMS